MEIKYESSIKDCSFWIQSPGRFRYRSRCRWRRQSAAASERERIGQGVKRQGERERVGGGGGEKHRTKRLTRRDKPVMRPRYTEAISCSMSLLCVLPTCFSSRPHPFPDHPVPLSLTGTVPAIINLTKTRGSWTFNTRS